MAVPITVPGDPSSPLTYTVPGSTAFIPRAASANFDGSGAGGDFLPCMKWVAQSGQVIGRFIAPQVAAGGSAEVSWAPFLGSAGVDAIRFDTPNLGDWLQIETTGHGAAVTTDIQAYTGLGVGVVADNGDSVVIGTNGGGDIHLDSGDAIYASVEGFGGSPNGEIVLGAGNGTDLTVRGFSTTGFTGGGTNSSFSVVVQNPIELIALGGTTSATVNVRIDTGNYFSIFNPTLTSEWLRVGSNGIFMFHLPTVNPGVAGQLWNSGGFVKIV